MIKIIEKPPNKEKKPRGRPFIDYSLRYIYKTRDNHYMIQKVINNKPTYFGRFATIKEAQIERDMLEEYNWDWDEVDGQI